MRIYYVILAQNKNDIHLLFINKVEIVYSNLLIMQFYIKSLSNYLQSCWFAFWKYCKCLKENLSCYAIQHVNYCIVYETCILNIIKDCSNFEQNWMSLSKIRIPIFVNQSNKKTILYAKFNLESGIRIGFLAFQFWSHGLRMEV